MGKYVMALDAGTTSNRCILFDREGNMVSAVSYTHLTLPTRMAV